MASLQGRRSERMNGITLGALELPARDFAGMTHRRFRPALEAGDAAPREDGLPFGTFMAVGASAGGVPVGLCLAVLRRDQSARILSIFVAAPFRRMGIGAALCSAVCERLIGAGGRTASVFLGTRAPGLAEKRAFVEAAGWPPLAPMEYRVGVRADAAISSQHLFRPLLRRLTSWGFETTPWGEMDDADKDEVARLVEAMEDRILDPARWPKYDPAISIALRQNGRVVGWILGENLLHLGYCHYVCGYVAPELQPLGWLLGGTYEVCLRQGAAYGPASMIVYEAHSTNVRMVESMKRRIAPFALWDDELLGSTRKLP